MYKDMYVYTAPSFQLSILPSIWSVSLHLEVELPSRAFVSRWKEVQGKNDLTERFTCEPHLKVCLIGVLAWNDTSMHTMDVDWYIFALHLQEKHWKWDNLVYSPRLPFHINLLPDDPHTKPLASFLAALENRQL